MTSDAVSVNPEQTLDWAGDILKRTQETPPSIKTGGVSFFLSMILAHLFEIPEEHEKIKGNRNDA